MTTHRDFLKAALWLPLIAADVPQAATAAKRVV
jgi:hypothetical protein